MISLSLSRHLHIPLAVLLLRVLVLLLRFLFLLGKTAWNASRHCNFFSFETRNFPGGTDAFPASVEWRRTIAMVETWYIV